MVLQQQVQKLQRSQPQEKMAVAPGRSLVILFALYGLYLYKVGVI